MTSSLPTEADTGPAQPLALRRIESDQASINVPGSGSAGPLTIEVTGLPGHLDLHLIACHDGQTPREWPFMVGPPISGAHAGPSRTVIFGGDVHLAPGAIQLRLAHLRAYSATGLLIMVAHHESARDQAGIEGGKIGFRFVQDGTELGAITGMDVPPWADAAAMIELRLVGSHWNAASCVVPGTLRELRLKH